MEAYEKLKNLFSIEGKVALITGAGTGIGKTIADGFKKAGSIVYYGIHHLIEEDKDDKFKIELDITDNNNRHYIIEKIKREQNKLDILVNSVGITKPENYDVSVWNKTLEINLTSIMMMCLSVKDIFMINQRKGSIINTTSVCADMAFSNNPAYNVSKAGLKMLTKSMAKDWSKYGIRVNNLHLGYFKTKMTQGSQDDPVKYKKRCERIMLDRFGNTEEAVGPAIFLASYASSYVTGSDLIIDGGFTSNGV